MIDIPEISDLRPLDTEAKCMEAIRRLSARPGYEPQCDDCTQSNCKAWPHSRRPVMVWQCERCGNLWHVPIRQPWYRRLITWILEPLK